jgi:hypothetical protein
MAEQQGNKGGQNGGNQNNPGAAGRSVIPEGPRFEGVAGIEIGDERNRNFMWAPTQEILRGRWERSNLLGDELVAETNQMPDIPGLWVMVDGRKRELRLLDPLNDPKNRDLSRALSMKVKAFLNLDMGPQQDRIWENASDSLVKEWLYWMRRLVNGAPVELEIGTGMRKSGGPQAKVLPGTQLPSLNEIYALSGGLSVGRFDSNRRGDKSLRNTMIANGLDPDLVGLTR